MTRYQLILAVTLTSFEVSLCILVYMRNVQRRLPLFASYVTVILIACLCQESVMALYGFQSKSYIYFVWISYGVVLIFRTAAIAELCRNYLKAYQGIWALAWRLLAMMSLLLLLHGAIDAQGQPNWVTVYRLTIEKDIDISSFFILATILLIGRYYRLQNEPFQKWIAICVCFYCLMSFASGTVLRNLFMQFRPAWAVMNSEISRVNNIHSTILIAASCISLGIWSYLLRKPLPEPVREPVLLPAEVYQELSPAINLRMRAFNRRLVEMLKP